jgi:hypothetical protein
MTSIIKVDTIQDQDGNNIINENANTITIGASGDTITIPSGATIDASGATVTLPTTIEVDAVEPQSGTSLTLGASGDTITIPSGATITNSGTATGFGKVLQVVQTVLTTTTSTTSTSAVDISGLSLSITPSSASNKVFILVDMALSESTANNLVAWNLVRNSTNLAVGTSSATFQQTGVAINDVTTGGNMLLKQSTQYLDSPSTTSATTYKIQWKTSGGTIYINRRATDTYMSVSSMITAFEIEA